MSFRRLSVLIKHLPADSELVSAVAPDVAERASWGTTDHLLASLIDRYNAVNFKNPRPVPRPDDLIAQRQKAATLAARLAEQTQRVRSARQAAITNQSSTADKKGLTNA